ncbi:MAG: methylated-DNA--[protein]-cysteine S-methyltransferase [Candidatus Eremiobacteraeota bacterium]|nr:methylated-DNA--[protein]-cysteine S-methyltransferase [Candidatus Eremiobacteraeota bacterium]MBC5802543.1 methylated-DNA--[protein]-cysteine S-methyltransferase [Candidatus Eremiobacteraeota bacterium]MBC5821904.1 methylated-DNA--[protein]-cysteine S-methyltransferase [Candidatus Eremiobacteraeota bacterium]
MWSHRIADALRDRDEESAVVGSPFGARLYVACDTQGIVASRWTRAPTRDVAKRGDEALLGEAVRQLRAYFAGRLERFDVPLRLTGTPFEVAVWSAVAQLRTGTLISYADVARAIGRPRAYRGVARALARTPLALFIPAHRVVGADGRLKGASAASLRRRLITFESRLVRRRPS